jgi:hypothetical protein
MAAALRPGKEVKLSVRIPEAEDEDLLQERFPKDIVVLLISFRIVNALCVSTFFQPDEYFQALEPAWQVAFGSQSGAWITWVSCDTSQWIILQSSLKSYRNGNTSFAHRFIQLCSLRYILFPINV